MANKKSSKKRTRKDNNPVKPVTEVQAATHAIPATVPPVTIQPRLTAEQIATQPEEKLPVVVTARAAAIRRSTEGKFNKVVLTQIGGAECPRFYPMTWKERDLFMSKPEGAAVKARYEAHMESVKN